MGSTRRRTDTRPVRLSETLADHIRQRIFAGGFPDDVLPRLDVLTAEYDVSAPTMREALRVLETEGLITIRRGNKGGGVVHRPTARTVARSLATVLQGENVSLRDVAHAIEFLEPMCAQLCAERSDRGRAVVPLLRENCTASREAIDDGPELARLCNGFHSLIVSLCGNETLRILSGAAESLWLAHTQGWTEQRIRSGKPLSRSVSLKALRTHERVTDHIAAGEGAKAAALMRRHFDPWQFHDDPRALDRAVDSHYAKGLFEYAQAPDARRANGEADRRR